MKNLADPEDKVRNLAIFTADPNLKQKLSFKLKVYKEKKEIEDKKLVSLGIAIDNTKSQLKDVFEDDVNYHFRNATEAVNQKGIIEFLMQLGSNLQDPYTLL